MERKYPMISAAVAAAIGAGMAASPAQAAAPTVAQAAAPTVALVMAGSSAAKAAISTAIQTDLCGGAANTLSLASSGGTKNFLAFSCNTAVAISNATTGNIPVGTLVTIYYRVEGGSVVGALPIATGHTILRLNVGGCSSAGTCTVSGTTATNGPNDSWTGAVTPDTVQLGLTDIEPKLLTGLDYPTVYSASAFGTASAAQMAALPTVKALDQVFGLVVNTTGLTLTGSGINLTRESARNILLGNVSDWSAVPDALTGKPISSASAKIVVVNREPGSGTRTATNTYFMDYQCSSSSAIGGTTGNYATSDELNQANTTNSSIAYASIDNILNPTSNTYPNLTLATINGVTPSNLAAATGEYDFWYEATFVPNTSVTGLPASLSSFITTDVPQLAKLPSLPDTLAIPGVAGNTGALSLTKGIPTNGATGTLTVYQNPYTRGSSSCNLPGYTVLKASP